MSIIHIEYIFISAGHNFVGHHGGPAGDHPPESRTEVTLLAGRGIAGDRYVEHPEGHSRQITFFDLRVFDELSEQLGRSFPPSAVRRNVFLRGLSLPSLVGWRFQLQGVLFEGVDPCKPCYWMNEAVGPGAEEHLQGRGGLRARILEDGVLRVGPAELKLLERVH